MKRISRRFGTSIAVVALAGVLAPLVANASPLSNVFHFHPRPAVHDDRVSFTLYNKATCFRDVMVGGKRYTVDPKHNLYIKAPTGTRVYAASSMFSHRRGSVVLEVTSEINNHQVVLD